MCHWESEELSNPERGSYEPHSCLCVCFLGTSSLTPFEQEPVENYFALYDADTECSNEDV